nr:hypothetical protein ISGA_09905 [Gordonia sp. NB41Y]
MGSIAGYRLLGPIRIDGIGQVFLGDHDTPPRREDVRVLPPGATADDSGARFGAQTRALTHLDHPGLPRITHHGIDQQYAWVATTHVDGAPLGPGRRDDAEAFGVGALIADALDHAHRNGVLHSDLAPEGILLTAASPPGAPGSVVVLDIGVIGLMPRRSANPLSGGPSYTAPEVRTGGTAEAPADQYSLAAILLTLLTGTPPGPAFTGFGAHRTDLTVLDPIFARALADSPAHRYPDCRSFIGSVTAARSATIPVADPVPSLRGRAQPTIVPTGDPKHTGSPKHGDAPERTGIRAELPPAGGLSAGSPPAASPPAASPSAAPLLRTLLPFSPPAVPSTAPPATRSRPERSHPKPRPPGRHHRPPTRRPTPTPPPPAPTAPTPRPVRSPNPHIGVGAPARSA